MSKKLEGPGIVRSDRTLLWLAGAAIACFVLFRLLTMAGQQAGTTAIETSARMRTSLFTVNRIAISLPQPGTVLEDDSSLSLRHRAAAYQKAATAATNTTTPTFPSTAIAASDPWQYGTARTTWYKAQNNIDEYRTTLRHHSDAIQAVIQVLEYRPEIDFAVFPANSEQGRERITRADKGIRAAIQKLEELQPHNDPYIRQDITALNTLRSSLSSLQKTGDTDEWVRQVQETQKKLVAHRTTYWNKAHNDLRKQHVQVNKALLDLEASL